MPRTIVLTSTFLRHQFLINTVAERMDLVGVWQEKKNFQPEKAAENDDDLKVIREHFASRDRSEEQYFGKDAALRLRPTTLHRKIQNGMINDPGELAQMIALKPEVVLVFGTGILRDAVIAAFDGNIINIHLGLSPYYRGSGTNFWPLVNGEPEYVGATIHYIDAGIDTGPMIAHARPMMTETDGPHDLGNKTIVAAADAQIKAAMMHVKKRLPAVPQQGEGKLYKNKDLNADAVRRMQENFKRGMIRGYLAHKEARDSKLKLLTLPMA